VGLVDGFLAVFESEGLGIAEVCVVVVFSILIIGFIVVGVTLVFRRCRLLFLFHSFFHFFFHFAVHRLFRMRLTVPITLWRNSRNRRIVARDNDLFIPILPLLALHCLQRR